MSSNVLLRLSQGHGIRSFFQPIVDSRNGHIIGYEALSRGPKGSPYEDPYTLFTAAEEAGLLAELEISCRELSIQRFFEQKLSGKLFINFSPKALISPSYPRGKTKEILEKYGQEPSALVIELSEKYPADDMAQLIKHVRGYRSEGFENAIDDLGAGYSGLLQWSEIRPDFVKLDRHFVHGIHTDSTKLAFARAITDLARSLGCRLIAEGVEDFKDVHTLTRIGIHFFQGYFFARPSENPPQHLLQNLKGYSSHLDYSEQHGKLRAKDLIRPLTPISPMEKLNHVWQRFQEDPDLSLLPVVEDGRVFGVILKSKIWEVRKQPTGKNMLGRWNASRLLSNNVMQVNGNLSLEKLSEKITLEESSYLRQHFIIVNDSGEYEGVGVAKDLLKTITRQQLHQARYNNPLTNLPGEVPISRMIKRNLANHKIFYIAYIDINYFKSFNDVYGYQLGDDAILLLANLLKRTPSDSPTFIGHKGGDDFVFICESDSFLPTLRWVQHRFNNEVKKLYLEEHINLGGCKTRDRDGNYKVFPFISISVAVVSSTMLDPEVPNQMAQSESMAKYHSKRLAGNGIYVLKDDSNISSTSSPISKAVI